MDENQNKSDEDRFEDGLRQILSNNPPPGDPGTAGEPRNRQARPEGELQWMKDQAEAESKVLFWFKLLRVLAVPTFLFFLAKFVMRIMEPR